jgi:hypothetical protein
VVGGGGAGGAISCRCLDDESADVLGDLGDYGVAEGSESVHPIAGMRPGRVQPRRSAVACKKLWQYTQSVWMLLGSLLGGCPST